MRTIHALLLLAFVSVTIYGHVTMQPPIAAPNTYTIAALRVPHGCNKSATVSLTVKVPEGVTNVKPKPVGNWTISLAKRLLNPPIPSGESMINETVDTVSWFGGVLNNDYYDDFEMQFKTPNSTFGTKLYWLVYQICASNVTEWTQVPQNATDQGPFLHPAPALTLVDPTTIVTPGVLANGSTTASVKSAATSIQLPIISIMTVALITGLLTFL